MKATAKTTSEDDYIGVVRDNYQDHDSKTIGTVDPMMATDDAKVTNEDVTTKYCSMMRLNDDCDQRRGVTMTSDGETE